MTNHYGIYGVHTQQPLVRYGRRVSAAINVPIRRQRRRQRIDCAAALYMNSTFDGDKQLSEPRHKRFLLLLSLLLTWQINHETGQQETV